MSSLPQRRTFLSFSIAFVMTPGSQGSTAMRIRANAHPEAPEESFRLVYSDFDADPLPLPYPEVDNFIHYRLMPFQVPFLEFAEALANGLLDASDGVEMGLNGIRIACEALVTAGGWQAAEWPLAVNLVVHELGGAERVLMALGGGGPFELGAHPPLRLGAVGLGDEGMFTDFPDHPAWARLRKQMDSEVAPVASALLDELPHRKRSLRD
jgi:hypothetical protein